VCTGYTIFVLQSIDVIVYFMLILSVVQGLATYGPQMGDIKRNSMKENIRI
jgi:hypothetical protein